MTLFGIGEYQKRRLQFEVNQSFSPTRSFYRKYPWLSFGLSVVLLLVIYLFHALYPNLNIMYLYGGGLLAAMIIDIALLPLELRMWRDWYGSLSPKDLAEFWWLTKHRIVYYASTILLCTGLAILIIVLVRINFP